MKKLFLMLAATVFLLPAQKSNAQTAGALNFDGANDYVSLGNPSAMQFAGSGAFSIEMWVNPLNTSGGWHSIIDKTLWGWGPTGTGLLLYINNGTLYLATPTWNTDNGVLFATPINSNTWTNIAFTYNNGTWNLYIDGDTVGNAVTGKYYTNSTSPWTIGMRTNNDGSGYTDPTSISVDELRIWNKELSATEINSHMSCELGSGLANLVGNYHFNQGTASGSNSSVTTVSDNSGNGNNGSLYNFALSGSTSNWINGHVTGICASSRKVTICHKGRAISVDSNSLPAHLGHGDFIGSCGSKSSSNENDLSEQDDANVKVYPNPTEGMIHVEVPESGKDISISVFDVSGRLVDRRVFADHSAGAATFNLEKTGRGMYFVKITTASGTTVHKVIVR